MALHGFLFSFNWLPRVTWAGEHEKHKIGPIKEDLKKIFSYIYKSLVLSKKKIFFLIILQMTDAENTDKVEEKIIKYFPYFALKKFLYQKISFFMEKIKM